MILNRPHPRGMAGLSQSFMRTEKDKEDELQAGSTVGTPAFPNDGVSWSQAGLHGPQSEFLTCCQGTENQENNCYDTLESGLLLR